MTRSADYESGRKTVVVTGASKGLDLDHPSFAAAPETNGSSMTAEDIDSVLTELNAYRRMGCDVANLSQGSTAGFTSADNELDLIYQRIASQAIIVAIAGGNISELLTIDPAVGLWMALSGMTALAIARRKWMHI